MKNSRTDGPRMVAMKLVTQPEPDLIERGFFLKQGRAMSLSFTQFLDRLKVFELSVDALLSPRRQGAKRYLLFTSVVSIHEDEVEVE